MFVIVPVLINIAVLFTGGYFAHRFIMELLGQAVDMLPAWLSFLSTVLSVIIMLSLGFVFCYFFAAVANIIASPFYGLLAERVERLCLKDEFEGGSDTIRDVLSDIPRIIGRELRKLCHYLPRVALCVIVSLIPILNIVSPLLWFMLAAWMMCIQYTDYAYDNHKIPFSEMRKDLSRHRLASFSIGSAVALGITVPVLNLIVMPAAVCAGTLYYLEIAKRSDSFMQGFAGRRSYRSAGGEDDAGGATGSDLAPRAGSKSDPVARNGGQNDAQGGVARR